MAPVTNAGPLPDGIPGTGRKVTIPGATFAEFDGDKVRWESLTSASEPGMEDEELQLWWLIRAIHVSTHVQESVIISAHANFGEADHMSGTRHRVPNVDGRRVRKREAYTDSLQKRE